MTWVALIPLKLGPDRKTRLATRFTARQRLHLSQLMADHVINTLRRTASFERLVVLSPERPSGLCEGWARDSGLGLNAEAKKFWESAKKRKLLIIHGDLPVLKTTDIQDLLASAEKKGVALAPDRHGRGTNALALNHNGPFNFRFGPDSRKKHVSQNTCHIAIVERIGLQFDIDLPEDLDAAIKNGFRF